MPRRILPLRPELRRNYEVVIVGGGIHGLSVAYNLARAGRTNIAVFERSYLGAGASGRNLTLIRNSWANPAWAGLIWRSSQLFRGLSTELGYNIMFTERGSYLCFREPRRADVAKTAVPMQNALGIPTQIVSADDLRDRLPQADTSGMLGAVYDPTAGISRHDALVWGWARAASRLGVHIHDLTPVTGMRLAGPRVAEVHTSRGSVGAQIVINAAGSASRAVGEMAGVNVPTRPHALEMFVTEPYEPWLTPLVSVIEDQTYIIQTSRGEFVAGAEPVGHDGTSLESSLAALRSTATSIARLFPRLRGANVVRAWAGLLDMSPDGAGLAGEAEERPGYYLDCGWGGEGYMVCPATGVLNAQLINTGVLDPVLAPFHYSRFESGQALADPFHVVDAAGETRA